MKDCLKLTLAIAVLSAVAVAQTGTNSSASGSAAVAPGQANAGVNAGQSAQAGGANAQVNASGSAQASRPQPDKPAQEKKHGADSKPESAGNGASAALASGTTLQAELTKPLDARKAKPGDQVTAKLTQDVKADGKVVVHKGSKLIGHVTEAQPHSKEQKESRLGIVFDKAELKGGQEASVNAVVQALAPPVRAAAAASGNESGNLDAPSAMGGGRTPNGGGLVGGVTGGATSAVGAVDHTVGGAAGNVNSTVGSTVSGAAGGLNAQGALASGSRGVIGLDGLSLSSATTAGAQGSVISSATHNVKLDSGTQMILLVSGAGK